MTNVRRCSHALALLSFVLGSSVAVAKPLDPVIKRSGTIGGTKYEVTGTRETRRAMSASGTYYGDPYKVLRYQIKAIGTDGRRTVRDAKVELGQFRNSIHITKREAVQILAGRAFRPFDGEGPLHGSAFDRNHYSAIPTVDPSNQVVARWKSDRQKDNPATARRELAAESP